ncbi:uncharacterized mitochondrial protein AtMg00810-like [Capsicum annuum]|uniref:uncharacterized mitochondrial protein AtMg00810-like n=1 Tax=Capsicum annuum TaxID=4072 RepID=UPI001FB0D0BA|nr:uncharacterized mitochondrial protein AtMg00810-like [Capsicum annuum]
MVSPLEFYGKFSANVGPPCPDPILYRKLVGKLNYLQHTQPDISFPVQHLSQFLHYPSMPYLEAGFHVLRYLTGSPGLGILLNNSDDFSLTGFCDFNWANYIQTRRSITSFYILFGGSPISWKSKKQPTIALFSTEAEYRALRKIMAEILWLLADLLTKSLTGVQHRSLLSKLGLGSILRGDVRNGPIQFRVQMKEKMKD